jgi:hypothetical protein
MVVKVNERRELLWDDCSGEFQRGAVKGDTKDKLIFVFD